MADALWQGAILWTIGQELRVHRMVARSLERLRRGRLFCLDFGDWFVLLGGSALIGLVTLLV